MTQQKGTEFALCLNSANRDVVVYPESNDFVLDLKDRYLHPCRRLAAHPPGPVDTTRRRARRCRRRNQQIRGLGTNSKMGVAE